MKGLSGSSAMQTLHHSLHWPNIQHYSSTEQVIESRLRAVMSGICTRHLKTTRRYLFSQHPANIFLAIKQLLQSHRFCVGQPHVLIHPSLPGFCLLCHPLSPVLSRGFILANSLQARSTEKEKKVVTSTQAQNFYGTL